MAQDTIEAIRAAELTAEQIEKNAAREVTAIIADANNKVVLQRAAVTKIATEKAQTNLAKAKRQGEQQMATALREAEAEQAALQKSAAANEPKAIRLILSELI